MNFPETRLLLIRHGETEWNRAGRWQGQLDSPLTQAGREQAHAVAERLKDFPFTRFFVSDLGRAKDTAAEIARVTGKVITGEDARLRERHFGKFQTFTPAEIQAQYPADFAEYKKGHADYQIPGGESANDRTKRTVECLNELVAKFPGEMILVVTHGGVLDGFVRHVLQIPGNAPRRFKFLNAAINIFVHSENVWTLETWGDVAHLDPQNAFEES
jgi:probable phosphoglycerate mutase